MTDHSTQSALARKARGLLTLARQSALLKSVPRTGWIDRGIARSKAESVADHSYGVALLAWAAALEQRAAGAEIDPHRVLELAMLHDLAEATTGDEPPYDPALVPDEDDAPERRRFLERRHLRDDTRTTAKRAAEDAAMAALLAALPNSARAELSGLWAELQDGASDEARFVKQADRLETFLQSRHYRRTDSNLPVASFQREVMETINDPLLSAMRDEALRNDPAEDG